MNLLSAAITLEWRGVPAAAVALAEKCAGVTQKARAAIKDLPQDGFLTLWYNEGADKLLLNCGDWMESEDLDQWREALEPLAGTFEAEAEIGDPTTGDNGDLWVKIAYRPLTARAFLEKRSASPTLNFLRKNLGYGEGPIPGSPSPLIAGLTSGILGAGLGYGGGWLAEKLMPKTWEKGKARRTGAVLGGLAGMSLPAAWMASNVVSGKPFYSGDFGKTPDVGYTDPQAAYDAHPDLAPDPQKHLKALDHHYPPGALSPLQKSSRANTVMAGHWPSIDVPRFHHAMFQDPEITSRIPAPIRAAGAGIMSGAQAISGSPRFVTPMDVAKITAGMSSGYLSGALIGKTLGLLLGMPEDTQQKLRRTGLWAGVAANVIPLAFGR